MSEQSLTSLKGVVGGLTATHASPDRIAEARVALKAAVLAARIQADVNSEPPLSDEDRQYLSKILWDQ
jgi:hypothetical protein